MHAPPKVRFVIANGEHARCVERGEHGFVTLHEMTAGDPYVPTHSKGGVHESASAGRSSAGDVDVHARRREDFAREVADHVNAEVAAHKFQRLALVAPARMMGALRADLSGPARALVVHEIDKDLTKVGNHDLDAWLRHPDLA